jgi:putative ABC transport system permease protein
VLLVSLRDLQWRIRRFALAALATGVVLGLALMVSGISNSFSVEIDNTVAILRARTWLVPAGSPGPFTASGLFPLASALRAAHLSGASGAAPLLVGLGAADPRPAAAGGGTARASLSGDKDVNLLGVVPGALGSPTVVRGRQLSGPGQAVTDESLGAQLGGNVLVDGHRFRVVGLVSGITYFAGEPAVFLDIGSLSKILAGRPMASAVLLPGPPRAAVPGFSALSGAEVRTDLNRPVAQAERTLTLITLLLWLVAAGIVAAIAYLSAIERRYDFAVLKAIGTPTSDLVAGIVAQSLAMACGAILVGFAVEAAAAPASAMAVRLSTANDLAMPLLAVGIGVLASLVPARRAARAEPALAFGASR